MKSSGRSAVVILVLVATACGDDGSATGSDGGTTGGPATTTTTVGEVTGGPGSATSADTSGGTWMPDPVACPPGPMNCDDASDCCAGVPPDVTCPGDYPLNWTCVSATCQLGPCSDDDECSALFTGFECMSIEGRNRCAAPCTNDTVCATDRNMPMTECVASGSPGRSYCRQPTD
jgi:hypothetical protein